MIIFGYSPDSYWIVHVQTRVCGLKQYIDTKIHHESILSSSFKNYVFSQLSYDKPTSKKINVSFYFIINFVYVCHEFGTYFMILLIFILCLGRYFLFVVSWLIFFWDILRIYISINKSYPTLIYVHPQATGSFLEEITLTQASKRVYALFSFFFFPFSFSFSSSSFFFVGGAREEK